MNTALNVRKRDDTTDVSTILVSKGRNLVQEVIAVWWIGEGSIPLDIDQVLRDSDSCTKDDVACLLWY
jgi:hypothetical protein